MELLRDKWNWDLLSIKPVVNNLFYKGNIDLLLNDKPKLAIVGSRRMSDYGLRVIEKWMPTLVAQGVTIVSGFMYGVDQAAHRTCIESGGKTIAVLGWGIENKVSETDKNLYENILEVDSLILSEWQDQRAERWTFPERNRIVAGISDAVLVIEGAEKSGSMITARLAKRFGKKLMALPGQVTSSLAGGTNKFIRQGKAAMVTSADDVLQEMNLGNGQVPLNFVRQHDPILDLLSEGDRSVDEITKLLRIQLPEALGRLTELSLTDEVVERAGKFGLK